MVEPKQSIKKGCHWHQAINLPGGLELSGDGLLRHEVVVSLGRVMRMLGLADTCTRQPWLTTVSRDMTHPIKSVSLRHSQPKWALSTGLVHFGKTKSHLFNQPMKSLIIGYFKAIFGQHRYEATNSALGLGDHFYNTLQAQTPVVPWKTRIGRARGINAFSQIFTDTYLSVYIV